MVEVDLASLILAGWADRGQVSEETAMDSWSRKYFDDLTDYQHDTNDAWFANMLKLLTPSGRLAVPILSKAFDKDGEEVDNFADA